MIKRCKIKGKAKAATKVSPMCMSLPGSCTRAEHLLIKQSKGACMLSTDYRSTALQKGGVLSAVHTYSRDRELMHIITLKLKYE